MCTVASKRMPAGAMHRFSLIAALGALGMIALGQSARAENKTVKFETWSCQPGKLTLTFTMPGNNPVPHDIIIPHAMTAEEKAAFIVADLKFWDPAGTYEASGSTVSMLKDKRMTVEASSGTTQEAKDILSCAAPGNAVCTFTGQFEPFDVNQQPAIFTAGIVTDVGELTTRVSAQDLNFQTDGPIICQALFQRLAPRAPQYGAQINYAGDRLEVYFDPAYTVTQGGVTFGTTSPSSGCSGGVELSPLGDETCGEGAQLNAVCKNGGATVIGKLKNATPGAAVTFTLDDGQPVDKTVNDRGKAKAKYTGQPLGRHTVRVCDLSASC